MNGRHTSKSGRFREDPDLYTSLYVRRGNKDRKLTLKRFSLATGQKLSTLLKAEARFIVDKYANL